MVQVVCTVSNMERNKGRIKKMIKAWDDEFKRIGYLGSVMMFALGLLLGASSIEFSGATLNPSWCFEFNETLCPESIECNEYCFWKYAEEQNVTEWCNSSSYCGQFTICPERLKCYNGVRNCRQYIFEWCNR